MRRTDKLAAGKFDVDVPLVRRLIAAQFPHWAGLPLAPVAEDGWDNWTFRLGDRLKVRLPSAEGYVGQVEKEARWLPVLAPHLPVPIPMPRGVGVPGAGYPWPWAVYDWIDGAPANADNLPDRVRFAREVAVFLRALQQIDPAGGPPPGQHNWFRGAMPMRIYGEEARRSVEALASVIDRAGAHAVLDRAAEAEPTTPPVWVHGDVAAGNLLVGEGRLAAVIDFGSSAVGDPACDLVITWTFFSGESREAFREAVAADRGMWARARGWALWKAALVLANNSPVSAAEVPPLEAIRAIIAEHCRSPS